MCKLNYEQYVPIIYLSIITINYNDSVGLERTITSVREQTAQDVEHIIIDGGSTDGSKELIEKYKDGFSYCVSEPDKGIYHAMNKGIAQVSGDYMLFLNSGDHFFESKSLQTLLNAAVKENYPDFVYGNILVMDTTPWIKSYPDKLSLEYFIKESLPHPATLIKSKLLNKQGYDTSLKIVADWKFFLQQIGKKGRSYLHVHEIISCFYLDGMSNSKPKILIAERKRVVKEEAPIFLKLHASLHKEKRLSFVTLARRMYRKCRSFIKTI